MRKTIAVILSLCIISICGCSAFRDTSITKSSDEVSVSDQSMDNEQGNIEDLGKVDVDKGILTVRITIPAEYSGGVSTQSEVDEIVAKKGYLSGLLHEDGSVTYEMSKIQHKEFLKETTDSFDKSLQETIDSGSWPNIVSITHNDDFTDFKVNYAGEDIGLNSLVVMQFYMMGGAYGIFSGNTPENIHVAFVNSETGAVIAESNSRDLGKTDNSTSND